MPDESYGGYVPTAEPRHAAPSLLDSTDEAADDASHIGSDRASIEGLLAGLNPRQREAVECLSGPLLVVAGPGSGKTRVLTHRIAALLRTGVRPWEVLAVTFTNKAAEEMRDRLRGLVGEEAVADMWVSTFHSACVKILRREHLAAGVPRSFTILDSDDAERVMRRVLVELNVIADPKEARGAARSYCDAVSWAKNRMAPSVDAERTFGLPAAAACMDEYQRRLAVMGSLDFDDLLLRTHKVLTEDDEARERYQRKFRHVLVDEYQDTNRVQLAITELLAGGTGNLCVVGDLQQAIYSWRGANSDGLTGFEHDHAGTKVVILDQNYRSTSKILEVCRAVIEPNPVEHRTELWTDQIGGDDVVLFEADDDREEASWVVGHVTTSGRPVSDHAVLFRTNAQTRVIEEALASSRIPYKILGAMRFFERAEIRDALAYLKLATNGMDAVSFERVASAPKRGVGSKTVEAVIARSEADGCDLIDACTRLAAASSSRSSAGLTSLTTAVRSVRAAIDKGPEDALRTVLHTVGLRSHWEAQHDGEGRVENLDEIVAAAADFVRPGQRTAEGALVSHLDGLGQTLAFLEHAALVAATDDVAIAQVQLMTVHAAKGREFPVVHVVGLEEKLFPHAKSIDSPDALEEERRLLFVACSRAEEVLTLSYCRSRYLFGKPAELTPSRFLADLPETVVRERAPRRRAALNAGYGRTRSEGRWASQPWGAPQGRRGGTSPTSSHARGASTSAARVQPAPKTVRAPRVVVPDGPRVSTAQVAVGDKVRHNIFGEGTVVEVFGADVRVRFTAGTKLLNAALAPMEKL